MKFFKEFAIYILIIALIVLVFGILFYEQLPSNKLIPVRDDYALPEKLESVLEDTLSTEEQNEILVTYTVKESDLEEYEDNDQYNPGKIDPFADYGTDVNNTNNNTGATGNGNSNSSNTNGAGGGQLTETKPGK